MNNNNKTTKNSHTLIPLKTSFITLILSSFSAICFLCKFTNSGSLHIKNYEIQCRDVYRDQRQLKQFQIQPEKALKTVSSEDKSTTIHAPS